MKPNRRTTSLRFLMASLLAMSFSVLGCQAAVRLLNPTPTPVPTPTPGRPPQKPASGGKNYEPVWSPDGERIAFVSSRDDNFEIYVMNADGSEPANLTNNSADDYSPAWSPDGKYIAFVSKRDGNRDGNREIYVMKADGSEPTNLTSK